MQLDLAKTRAAEATPASVMKHWAEDRFVAPAVADQRVQAGIEGRLWQMLPPRFVGVELAPVVPLGTCSAVAPVDRYTQFEVSALGDRIADTVRPALDLPTIELVEDPNRAKGAGYYSPVAIEIAGEVDGEEVELGDGGFVDWTAQLLGNAKERCLVSCLSTDRLVGLMGS